MTYDAAGNLIEKRRPDGSAIWYEYDADDQLIAVEGSDSGRIGFSYDALGRRRAKKTSEGEIGFLWDGDVLLAERRRVISKGGHESDTEYIHEPGSHFPAARLRWIVGGSVELEAYHVDHLGTPRELTDGSGSVVWKGDYDEYGRLESAVHSDKNQNVRFQGQYEDAETGLHYNLFRYYDPDSGRYLTKDPIGLAGGLNAYKYVPNPVCWIDPLGLNDCKIIVSKESHTLDLEGEWRATKFASGQKGIVYVLRDADTGEFLKVGKSEVDTFVGRFEKYQTAGTKNGRHLVLDVFTVDKSSTRTVQSIEGEIRSNMIKEGHALPWDNTDQRLGRPGPGVPGTRLGRGLRDSYEWQGEDLVPKS